MAADAAAERDDAGDDDDETNTAWLLRTIIKPLRAHVPVAGPKQYLPLVLSGNVAHAGTRVPRVRQSDE